MDEPKHIIFLAGFMGSGKSTVGPELAKKLRYDFVDIDDMIEEREKTSVSEIFERRGEPHFRALEREMLAKISRTERKVVVALGGGTLGNAGNRNLVKRDGVLVYLRANRNQILSRVQRKRDRPLLLGPGGEVLSDKDLSERVETLLRERERHYLEASVIVDTTNLEVPETVDEILTRLQGKIE